MGAGGVHHHQGWRYQRRDHREGSVGGQPLLRHCQQGVPLQAQGPQPPRQGAGRVRDQVGPLLAA
eukprot:4056200-Pyramimonas_sp.AAC.1